MKPSVPACGPPPEMGRGTRELPPRSRLKRFVFWMLETTILHPKESPQSMTQWVEQVILYMYPRLEIATETVERNGLKRLGKVVAKRVE